MRSGKRGTDATCRTDAARASPDDAPADDELLALARSGDPEAFAMLYHRHSGTAHRYAAYLSRAMLGRDCADDVTAEAVRKILSALRHGHGPTADFRLYLRAAIRSVTIEMSAQATRELPLADMPDVASPAADDRIDTLVGMRAFRSLPRKTRHLLWADMVDGTPPRELAPTLGTTPQHVALMSFRARQAFRVAYVREHLPPASDGRCHRALELLARSEVTALSPSHQRALSAHLTRCGSCARAETWIRGEVHAWPHASWPAGNHAAPGTPGTLESSEDVA